MIKKFINMLLERILTGNKTVEWYIQYEELRIIINNVMIELYKHINKLSRYSIKNTHNLVGPKPESNMSSILIPLDRR